jgi:hypothetical protein
LPAQPGHTPGKKPAVLVIKATPVVARSGRRNTPQQAPHGWQTVTNGAAPTTPVAKPHVWGNVPDTRRSEGPRRGPNLSPFVATEFPKLSSASRRSSDDATTKAPAVQAPSAWAINEPESFVAETEELENGHPVVSQKKKSKKAREAKRKAKKLNVSTELADDPLDQEEATEEAKDDVEIISKDASIQHESELEDAQRYQELCSPPGDVDTDSHTDVVEQVVVDPELSEEPSPAPMPITKHGKHMHWARFNRNFVVDQLTDPFLPSWSGCSHRTSVSVTRESLRSAEACTDMTSVHSRLTMFRTALSTSLTALVSTLWQTSATLSYLVPS